MFALVLLPARRWLWFNPICGSDWAFAHTKQHTFSWLSPKKAFFAGKICNGQEASRTNDEIIWINSHKIFCSELAQWERKKSHFNLLCIWNSWIASICNLRPTSSHRMDSIWIWDMKFNYPISKSPWCWHWVSMCKPWMVRKVNFIFSFHFHRIQ